MDLIEKFCCWKYIFVQLNAGCLQVPTISVYLNVDAYWGTHNFSSQCLLCCMIRIWNQKYCFFCECRSISYWSFELKEKCFLKAIQIFWGWCAYLAQCFVVSLYVVSSSLEKQGWKVFDSDVSWDDGLISWVVSVGTNMQQFFCKRQLLRSWYCQIRDEADPPHV